MKKGGMSASLSRFLAEQTQGASPRGPESHAVALACVLEEKARVSKTVLKRMTSKG